MSTDRYRVIWRNAVIRRRAPEIIDALIERGEAAKPVYQAMARIFVALATDPDEQGESRADGERVFFDEPVSVTYEVHEDEKVVFILTMTYYKPKSERE